MGNIYTQHYMRGEVLDEKNKLIPNATIYMHSNKMQYSAGSSGSFGLMSSRLGVDTFTIIVDGYEKTVVPIFENKYNTIKIKLLASVAFMQKPRLSTLVKDLKNDRQFNIFTNNESYSNLVENEFIKATSYPTTGFAVNTDKASYSNIRRFINTKSKVPTNAVRINEMINYFNLAAPTVLPNQTFAIQSQLASCPWNVAHQLLFVNIAAKKIDLEKLPNSNLVFLVDNSGSMELQNRLPLLKAAFRLLVNNLRTKDTIAIVTYGGRVDVALPPISGYYKDSILKVIEAMDATGDTPGESAIKIAYGIAKNKYTKTGNNRVILATDGDFNVGIADEEELQKLITIQSQTGIYLTCLGIGMGNYKDSKLEVLAKKGNGNFAYIDSETEAEKVLVKEMTQTLYSVADKTFMNITFNPNLVSEYRLLGFDNKQNALADTSSQIDGGEVGSGYSGIIVFEIEPTKNLVCDTIKNNTTQTIATLNIQYIDPTNKANKNIAYTCSNNYKPNTTLPKQYLLASAIAMFGGYVKQSNYFKNVLLDDILKLAQPCTDATNSIQVEFLQLVEKAKKIYEPSSTKKRKGKGGKGE